MTQSYIEQCKEKITLVSVPELARFELGSVTDEGRLYTTRSLGRVTLGFRNTHVGLRIPTLGITDSREVLVRQIAVTETILQIMPELRHLFPEIMGLLAVGSAEECVAVITEDVSKRVVQSRRLSGEARMLLTAGFGVGGRLAEGALENGLWGGERFSNTLTPTEGRVGRMYENARQAAHDLTIVIRRGTNLAREFDRD